ncbi:cation:proton antiporter domain-containing protein [Nocardia sp. CA-119907]|uniref:cation:proton antiporter domain-containing protein n=1 Tax=Nocardia sp. CA-119907 TaxID=3239973 RepID=UPI003D976107
MGLAVCDLVAAGTQPPDAAGTPETHSGIRARALGLPRRPPLSRWPLGFAGSKLTERLAEASWGVALTLLLPFAAYGVAEAFSESGVLAVLACALYPTEAGTDFGDRDYRPVGDACGEITEMLLSGFAFGLIGLELGVVLDDTGNDRPRLLGIANAVVAVVVVLRLV